MGKADFAEPQRRHDPVSAVHAALHQVHHDDAQARRALRGPGVGSRGRRDVMGCKHCNSAQGLRERAAPCPHTLLRLQACASRVWGLV